MTWLIYTGFLIGPAVSNLMPKYLPALNLFGAGFNILGGLIWAIVFLVMAPKQTASFVFTEFINSSGYTSSGWVFILSMYVPIYGLYGTDGVMHLVEEMKNASRDAPVRQHLLFVEMRRKLMFPTARDDVVYGLGWSYSLALCNCHVLDSCKLGNISRSQPTLFGKSSIS